MATITPKDYFQKVILEYNRGDIEALLNGRFSKAGPLLACVVNGIDAMGGLRFGFSKGSANRSTRFMLEHMGIAEQEAKSIYRAARCGLVHEGVPKPGVKFFVEYEVGGEQRVLYKDADYVWLNVVGLATKYLSALNCLDRKLCAHLPPPSKAATQSLRLARTGLPDMMDYCSALSHARRKREEAQYDRGELDQRSSSSAVLPEHLAPSTIPGTSV